jgi:hypothetical protein
MASIERHLASDTRVARRRAPPWLAALVAGALCAACAGPLPPGAGPGRPATPARAATPAAPGVPGSSGAPAAGAAAAPAGGAGAPGAIAPPDLGWFSHIKVPENHQAILQLAAHGAQVFRCEAQGDGHYAWAFRQPDAELRDMLGQPAGRHGASFSFESIDGSRLIGRVIEHDAAPAGPQAGALPWLLIATDSFGDGIFAGVDYVQRVNTLGGLPPPSCIAAQDQQVLRVDFNADFVFYRPR